ncbi:MAG TPA: sigma-70 family RNA polymerase sigma factor [Candidatus Acidoferrum sp.]|nr:sigma-70 family RNA polymerase sigma factor [Candidatus Acidoferrum sp.]
MSIAERFAQGDRDAFEELFREYQGDVYRWVMRIVRDTGVAEDLTVEAFWKIFQAHARFDPDRNFAAWARRIATNLALDQLRKRRRELPLLGEPKEQPAACREANPGERAEAKRWIEQAMNELPPKLRVVATLALIEEVTYREIGEALGIPEATARVRGFRAVRMLREKLKNLGTNS